MDGSDTRAEQAACFFGPQGNCAQAILATYGPDAGLELKSCLKIAAPFGGGISRLGEACGAVTGAVMVLGLRYAAPGPEAKALLYGRVQEFVSRFRARHGSMICRELLGFEVGAPGAMQQPENRQVHDELCPQLVRTAAEILEDMLTPATGAP